MVHKSLTYQIQNLILEHLTFENPAPARNILPFLNHLPANPSSRQKLQCPFYTGSSQKKIWESREQGKGAGRRGDLGQGRMFNKQKSWQALCLASELCVTSGVTGKNTLIRMSSGKGGCEQIEECSPCDHVCSQTNCSKEPQRHTRSSTKSDYLTPVSAFLLNSYLSDCHGQLQSSTLQHSGRGSLNWGTASIQLAYGHVYEAFSELVLDANAGGSSPLWVVPSLGLDCTRTLVEWAGGSKPVSSISPGSLLQFLSGAPAQGCPDDEHNINIINPFLSTLLLIMVYQAL